MAGTITETSRTPSVISKADNSKQAEKVIVTWVGDASDGTTPALSITLHGFLLKVVTNPGSPAPTDNYDIKLGDPDDSSLDALATLIENRDTANSEQVYTLISGAATPIFLNGTYSLTVTGNSVASATGTITFYLVDSI